MPYLVIESSWIYFNQVKQNSKKPLTWIPTFNADLFALLVTSFALHSKGAFSRKLSILFKEALGSI